MSGLQSIGVKVEGSVPPAGNAVPLLHEIRHALDRLARDGTDTVIDLLGVPLGPGDLDRLLATLGEGEVDARLRALGESRIRETAYSGVWLVEHYNPDGALLARSVEVTYFPAILRAQPLDVAEAAARLSGHLAAPQAP